MNIKFFTFLILLLSITLWSCGDDDNDSGVIESYNVELSSQYEVAHLSDRAETGLATIRILDNNTLEFSIIVNDLSSSDALTAAHIHTGDVLSNGGVVAALVDGSSIAFNGNSASGTIEVTNEQIVDIHNGDVYVNVHSTEVPAGLVRGQIGMNIEFAGNVMLSPDNEIPAITGRNETGMAFVRIVGDKIYYMVSVTDLAASDMITSGHIHEGSSTEIGEIVVDLNLTEADLGTVKSLDLTATEKDGVINNSSYVNIHSEEEGSGLLRGQLVD